MSHGLLLERAISAVAELQLIDVALHFIEFAVVFGSNDLINFLFLLFQFMFEMLPQFKNFELVLLFGNLIILLLLGQLCVYVL